MSDSEDDFATYGSALEPLDEENLPRKKPVTLEDQYACDAQGRRRFHGAFTGGFSAGYFNTVGTRDGWRPQQFKSTRSSKAENLVQRPEDFMDEEDTGNFGFAPTAIRATAGYSDQTNKGTKRERTKQDSTGPIPGTPVLKDLLKPVRERVGVTLLKKMGWKPGQGVGPRLTKQEKKQQKQQKEKVKIYGCSLPNQQEKPSDSESDSSDDEYANITFAPDDYEPYRCNPKDNYFGIGYSGLDRRPVLSQHINLFDGPTFSVQDKNKKLSIRGQAFGVGAFEAEDEDIYAKDDMSRYDFALGPEKKSKNRWSKEEKTKSGCIEGFVPSKLQFPDKKVFPAPALPKDFQPVHKIKKSRFSPVAGDENQRRNRYEMNAESRAKIINDERPSIIDSTKVESKKSSVAAQMISRSLNLYGKDQVAERQRLEQERPKKTSMSWLDKISATTFVKGETMGDDPKIQGSLKNVNTFISESNKLGTNLEETTLVKPSFPDLDKQRRFEQYLKFSESERKLKFASIQPLSMTDWERDREVEEFEKAARLCERIDSMKESENKKKEEEKNTLEKVDLDSLNTEDRMVTAAKMKMFGKLTRKEEEWKPGKLVCVRFNVAEPFVGVADEDKKKKKFSIFDSVAWDEMARFEKGKLLEYEVEPGPSTSSDYSFSRRRMNDDDEGYEPVFNIRSKQSEEKKKSFEETYERIFQESSQKKEKETTTENKKVETQTKQDISKKEDTTTANLNVQQKKDLFKSIFLSSSEDSESESEETKPDDEKIKAALIGKSAAQQNAQRNTSPPRGIFAKLDLDSLMKRPDKTDTLKKQSVSKVNESKESDEIEIKTDDILPSDAYGPLPSQAPPQVNESLDQKPVYTDLLNKAGEMDDSQWVEKSRDKKKSKKEKKKHKHKERSKSKSRKKAKKEKRH